MGGGFRGPQHGGPPGISVPLLGTRSSHQYLQLLTSQVQFEKKATFHTRTRSGESPAWPLVLDKGPMRNLRGLGSMCGRSAPLVEHIPDVCPIQPQFSLDPGTSTRFASASATAGEMK